MLGQVAVDGKSNKITAVPNLLEMLSLQGKVVTANTMHCQRQVVEQGVDYTLALKGDQGTLHDDVKLFLEDLDTPVARVAQIGKEHRRIASFSADIDWLGLRAVGKVTATRRKDGEASEETCYYLLNGELVEPLDAGALQRLRAGTLGIENRLHCGCPELVEGDVTNNEDQARNRKGCCAENLARLEPGKVSIRGKLKRAGWDGTAPYPNSPKSTCDSPGLGRAAPGGGGS